MRISTDALPTMEVKHIFCFPDSHPTRVLGFKKIHVYTHMYMYIYGH